MKPKNVDEYISSAPIEIQDRLKQIRKIIKEMVPEAEEKISYGMPYYGYNGRLAYFSYFKNHIGLYIPPPAVQENLKALAGYETAMATVRLPLNRSLPVGLIRKLIKSRLKKLKHK